MAKLRTLAEARKDKRIYLIEKIDEEDGTFFYRVWLEEGWMFDDGMSTMMSADSLKELLDIINNEIIEGTPE